MNILFLTLLDFSSLDEKGIYTDLMREFSKNNHNVYIISPTEKRKGQPTRLLNDRSANILKLQIGNTQKTNIIEKGISTLTLENKFKQGIKTYFDNIKFDLILYSTPPITLYGAIKYVKERDNAKTYLLLKDIFPQNAVDIGMLKKKGVMQILYTYFRYKEKKLYSISDIIGCMSEANSKYVLKHNSFLSKDKVEVCPNSIEPLKIKVASEIRQKIRIRYEIPLDKKVFIYGGNLGKPQGIEFLMDCVERNEKNSKSFILIVGTGTEFNKLNNFFEKLKPQNAKLLKQLPKNDYENLANSCDVGLIFLDSRFTIPNFPSRLLSYMQASMPVLAATDISTDLKDVIESGEFGYWVESGNLDEFNQSINELCKDDIKNEMGRNSRKYFENNYTTKHSYDIIMKHHT